MFRVGPLKLLPIVRFFPSLRIVKSGNGSRKEIAVGATGLRKSDGDIGPMSRSSSASIPVTSSWSRVGRLNSSSKI